MKNELDGACRIYGEGRGAYRILVRKLEGRRPTGRPTHRWEENIKMYLQELGWETCTGLIWLRRGESGSNEPAVP